MTEANLDNFHLQENCIYKEEHYLVRDNGAVLRQSRTGKRFRSSDDQWTFGTSIQKGYMHIGSERVHRIVATAFHGKPPTADYVVDHIDTNRCNNRPENLRWLTRLENVLRNPVTKKKIELILGSIEVFLEDPSKLPPACLGPKLDWMRRVTPQEAQACRERMDLWAKSDKPPTGGGSLGEWVFKPSPTQKLSPEMSSKAHGLVMAKTPGAAQRKWRTPSEFLCCPQKEDEKSIAAYAAKLTAGSIFSRNDFSTSIVRESTVVDDSHSFYVVCEQAERNAVKPWSLARVTFEGGLYVHTSLGTFFSRGGAEKQFCLTRGLEWTGGDTFDDYC